MWATRSLNVPSTSQGNEATHMNILQPKQPFPEHYELIKAVLVLIIVVDLFQVINLNNDIKTTHLN